jgi:hypothetical protein
MVDKQEIRTAPGARPYRTPPHPARTPTGRDLLGRAGEIGPRRGR